MLRRKYASNGSERFFWYCPNCNRHANQRHYWISHKTIKRWQGEGRLPDNLEQIPVIADYRENVSCVVCGRPGAEYHHFAPQSLADFFGDDWHLWPTAYLCRKHHDQWHDIVTFYLPGRRDHDLAQRVARRFIQEGERHAQPA